MKSASVNIQDFIEDRVSRYYWNDDINCARTVLKILAEHFQVPITDQLYHAAVGMHGAGGYRAQCGLVEGALMFLGIFGNQRGFTEEQTTAACKAFAEQFENNFSSLQCRFLRPEGFSPDNLPHLCEPLTHKAILNSIEFIESLPA